MRILRLPAIAALSLCCAGVAAETHQGAVSSAANDKMEPGSVPVPTFELPVSKYVSAWTRDA
jgi:hypothetical protein